MCVALQVVDDCDHVGGISSRRPAQQGPALRSSLAASQLGSHSITIPQENGSSTLPQEQQRPAAARVALWGIQSCSSSGDLYEGLLQQ